MKTAIRTKSTEFTNFQSSKIETGHQKSLKGGSSDHIISEEVIGV